MATFEDQPAAPSATPAATAPATPDVAQAARATAARLGADRLSYTHGHLDDDAPADPFALFSAWMEAAFDRRTTEGDLPEPTAVVLSTVAIDAQGLPWPRSRTVLLKGIDEESLVVYTNRESAKGRELSATPRASLLLPWYPLQRQVRIEGEVQEVEAEECDAYFATRPRGSQLGAWASRQSQPVTSRQDMDAQFAQVEDRFAGIEVPRPPHWGGYRLLPQRWEFWQGRADRMHDRLVFECRADGGWSRVRLQP